MEDYTCVEIMGTHYDIRTDMMDELDNYLQDGIPPGDFLRAVLANDLVGAVGRADKENLHNLPAYANYLYWELPGRGSPNCPWGSYEAVESYLAAKADT